MTDHFEDIAKVLKALKLELRKAKLAALGEKERQCVKAVYRELYGEEIQPGAIRQHAARRAAAQQFRPSRQ